MQRFDGAPCPALAAMLNRSMHPQRILKAITLEEATIELKQLLRRSNV